MNNSTCALLTYSSAVHFIFCSQIPSRLGFAWLCIVLQVVLRILCYCCRNTSEESMSQQGVALLNAGCQTVSRAAFRPFWSDKSTSRAPNNDGWLFFSSFAEVRGPHLSHMMDSQMKCLRLQCLFPALTSEAPLYCKTLCFT